jgi:hypothetical protein
MDKLDMEIMLVLERKVAEHEKRIKKLEETVEFLSLHKVLL